MRQYISLALLALSALSPMASQSAQFADSVISYTPGTGFATVFGSGAGYTNAMSALGEPSRETPGAFGGPVDPFSPPFLKEQLVSVGSGGSLTVGFSQPILNDPSHKFGLDFTIYGNTGFVITNGNFSGGGITDGSLFGANEGTARVSVSRDNVTFFDLDPGGQGINALFPTDGQGSFDLAINPDLLAASFAGQDLAGIRTLYDGAAGGAGFDISWARTADGQPAGILLPDIRYVRIEVLSGAVEIDGMAAPELIPEPSSTILFGVGLALFIWAGKNAKRRISGDEGSL